MMFKLLVMQVRGLMEDLFMSRCLSMEQQLLHNAKPLPVSTIQESQAAARKPRPRVSRSQKHKPKVAQPTTAAKLHKAEPKPAQTTSGKPGRPRKTVA